MGRAKRSHGDVERRLFEISIGPLRLLDSVLEKAGERAAAALLRELLLDWRAYPSRSLYSAGELRSFVMKLGKIEMALHRANEEKSAGLVSRIGQEIERWIKS